MIRKEPNDQLQGDDCGSNDSKQQAEMIADEAERLIEDSA